jgi:hypothetical protein
MGSRGQVHEVEAWLCRMCSNLRGKGKGKAYIKGGWEGCEWEGCEWEGDVWVDGDEMEEG